MKIGIIGYGFVGRAIHSVIYPRNNVSIVDPKLFELTIDELLLDNPDIIFISVPTPTVGTLCDDSLVMGYIEKLKSFPGMVAIKSTIPVSTVEKVLAIRPTTVIWPEFLRQKNAEHEVQFPDYIVVGAPSAVQFHYISHFIKTETKIVHGSGNRSIIQHVTPKGASAFKYAVNAFLATKVVFFHQMQRWLETRGDANVYDEVTMLMEGERRIGGSHMDAPGEHGYGYAGSCFPKDVQALLHQVNVDGWTFPLLDAVDSQNEYLRKLPVNSP